MFKLIFLTVFFVSVALCHEEDLEVYDLPEEDILVPAESLSPRTLVRFRRQLFGGFNTRPFGGFDQNIGYRGSVFKTPTKDLSAWGSLSQSGSPGPFGRTNLSPATFRGGADFTTTRGHGLSGSLSHTDRLGGSGTVAGNLNLLSTNNHKLDGFASHTRPFDGRFNSAGRGSTTLGTKWLHSTGAEASLSGTRTPGQPNVFQYSAAAPLFDGKAAVGLNGKTIDRLGTQATLSGKAQVTDNLHAFGSHTKVLDTRLNPLGSSSTLGAGYNNPRGLEITASGTKTSGQPNSAMVGASLPLFTSKDGNTKVLVAGQSEFKNGHKPNHQAGLTLSTNF